jgi:hypothetical protein
MSFPLPKVKPLINDTVSVPLPEDHVFRKGDSVLIKALGQRGCILGVYFRQPSNEPVYLVATVTDQRPNLFQGSGSWLQTLGPQDIAPPAVNWKRRETNWWDEQYLYTNHPAIRDTFKYWPVPLEGWKPGHLASVPSFITPDQRQCVCVKRPEGPHMIVEFPVLINRMESPIVFMYCKEDLSGPHVDWDLSAFTWHKAYGEGPAVNVETAIAALHDDNEQDDAGLPSLNVGGNLEEDGVGMPSLDLGRNAITDVESLLNKDWILTEPKIPSNQSDVLQAPISRLNVHGSSRDQGRGDEEDFDVNALFADGGGK